MLNLGRVTTTSAWPPGPTGVGFPPEPFGGARGGAGSLNPRPAGLALSGTCPRRHKGGAGAKEGNWWGGDPKRQGSSLSSSPHHEVRPPSPSFNL